MDENIFELDGKTFNLENSKERTDLEFEYKYLNKNEREWATEDLYKGTDEYEKINSEFDQKLEKFPDIIKASADDREDVLERLASDSNDSIREAVLDNPNASERVKDIVEKMNELDSTPNAVADAFSDENKNTETIEVKEKSSLRM